jgi:hypothetical protein
MRIPVTKKIAMNLYIYLFAYITCTCYDNAYHEIHWLTYFQEHRYLFVIWVLLLLTQHDIVGDRILESLITSNRSCDISVGIATCYGVNGQGSIPGRDK